MAKQIEDFADFMQAVMRVDDDETSRMMSDLEFKGFNPLEYQAIIMKDDPQDTLRIGLLGVMKGSNWDKYSEEDKSMLKKYGYQKKPRGNAKAGAKTVLRTTNTLAPAIALVIQKNSDKYKTTYRGNCPKCIQFPGAGSLNLGKSTREKHRVYCAWLALQLSSEFNETLYDTIASNQIPVPDSLKALLCD